jgi:uncharacterized protein (TIGR02145 family)
MNRFLAALPVALLVLSCRLDESTGDNASDRPVSARLARAESVDSAVWASTDSVHLLAQSVDGTRLLEKGLRFQGSVLSFGTVSAPVDQGVRLEAEGFAAGTLLWTASTTLPPANGPQTAVLTAALADPVNQRLEGTVATPTIKSIDVSPWSAPATWDRPVRVHLATATAGAVIRYRLDGIAPTSTSPVLGSDTGLRIDTTTRLLAAAFAPGKYGSTLLDTTLRLKVRPVSLDSAQPALGAVRIWDRSTRLFFSSPTPGATLRFTLDGTVPTVQSPVAVGGVVPVDSSANVQVAAFAGRAERSEVGSWPVLLVASQPHLDTTGVAPWAPDTFDAPLAVQLSTSTPGGEIRYTLDGSTPSASSTRYEGPIAIDTTSTLQAATFGPGKVAASEVLVRRFVLQVAPVNLMVGNQGWPPFRAGLSSSTANVAIRYTRDGSEPLATSPLYTDSLLFTSPSDSETVKGWAISTRHPRIAPSATITRRVGPSAPWNPDIEYESLRDTRDGRTYRVVWIGTSRWMAENLAYAAPGSMCYQTSALVQDDTTSCSRYGRLYPGTVALDGDVAESDGSNGPQGICPTGWHLPSAAEIADLTFAIAQLEGFEALAGKDSVKVATALRSRGGWTPFRGERNGADLVGMRFLPAGWHSSRARFASLGYESMVWTGSSSGGTSNEPRLMQIVQAGGVDPIPTTWRLTTSTSDVLSASVRCRKDGI